MTAYVLIIRNKTTDPAGMARYGELARLAPSDGIQILASKTCKFQVLEGEPVEAVVLLSFPTREHALAWYQSDEYQKALKHRQASGEFHFYLVDGVS